MQDPRKPIPGHTFGTCSPWYKYARLHTFQSIYTITCASMQEFPFPDFPYRFIATGLQYSPSTSRFNMSCGHRTVLMSYSDYPGIPDYLTGG